MGCISPPAPVPAAFGSVFSAAAGPGATMSFDRFMELALYHPDVGYYRKDGPRVGVEDGTDFCTAVNVGPVFGELIVAGARTLLEGRNPAEYTFVEIGAEPRLGVLDGVAHPFGAARTIRYGDPIELAGACVVFMNELFDAQPFRRFVYRGEAWREIAVRLEGGMLKHVELPPVPLREERYGAMTDGWPAAWQGYVVDAPVGAVDMMDRIAAQPWHGILICCDYGKSWNDMLRFAPEGTARGYYHHFLELNLLARPGEQDLTCHVVWDWLQQALVRHGFESVAVNDQESFFIKKATTVVEDIILNAKGEFDGRKQSLIRLLHPVHMGQLFQVLHAHRAP